MAEPTHKPLNEILHFLNILFIQHVFIEYLLMVGSLLVSKEDSSHGSYNFVDNGLYSSPQRRPPGGMEKPLDLLLIFSTMTEGSVAARMTSSNPPSLCPWENKFLMETTVNSGIQTCLLFWWHWMFSSEQRFTPVNTNWYVLRHLNYE